MNEYIYISPISNEKGSSVRAAILTSTVTYHSLLKNAKLYDSFFDLSFFNASEDNDVKSCHGLGVIFFFLSRVPPCKLSVRKIWRQYLKVIQ